MEIVDIEFFDPLRFTMNGKYIGQMTFTKKLILTTPGSDTPVIRESKGKAQVVLARVKKDFGSEKKLVWDVLLCEIL